MERKIEPPSFDIPHLHADEVLLADGRCESLRLMLCVCHVIERKRRERDSNPCSLGENSLLSSDEKNSAADSFKTFYKHDAPNHVEHLAILYI
jgi:hypothetical protein